jgi:hypothetical protein
MSGTPITLKYQSMSKLRAFLDNTVYDDASMNSSWSEMVSRALLGKDAHRLCDFASHGKGFNDSTKKAVCLLLGAPVVYTQKGMDALIAVYCGMSMETLLLERKLRDAKKKQIRAEATLKDGFSNGGELVNWVQKLIKQGYTSVLVRAGKSYLVDASKKGYHLPRTLIRLYAESCTEVLSLTARLADIKK